MFKKLNLTLISTSFQLELDNVCSEKSELEKQMQTTHIKLMESKAQVETEMTRYEDMIVEKEKELDRMKAVITQKVRSKLLTPDFTGSLPATLEFHLFCETFQI